MIKINAMGLACPIPVIQTKKAIKNLDQGNSVETLVDNEASMENLLKLAKELKVEATWEKLEDYKYKVIIKKQVKSNEEEVISEEGIQQDSESYEKQENNTSKTMVVAIASDKMGEGIDELGEVLMKGFIYTLTEMEELPKTIVFYNGGVKLTCEGAPTLEDLISLEEAGVEILSCGTCLNYYKIENNLKVGEVTNMYTIMERLQGADKVIKP